MTLDDSVGRPDVRWSVASRLVEQERRWRVGVDTDLAASIANRVSRSAAGGRRHVFHHLGRRCPTARGLGVDQRVICTSPSQRRGSSRTPKPILTPMVTSVVTVNRRAGDHASVADRSYRRSHCGVATEQKPDRPCLLNSAGADRHPHGIHVPELICSAGDRPERLWAGQEGGPGVLAFARRRRCTRWFRRSGIRRWGAPAG